jgi:hypothetical protein
VCSYLFLQVVSDLLSPISELLTSCHLANADIAHVVLVGGTTKVHNNRVGAMLIGGDGGGEGGGVGRGHQSVHADYAAGLKPNS